MKDADFVSLPIETRQFVSRLSDLGMDRTRIYGLFVMLGVYSGAPNTKEELDALFSRLSVILPIDRSKNIDEVIGHIYDGYDRELNEFCYRSGVDFEFREIKIPNVEKTFSIIYLKDEGLLKTNVQSVEKLVDATRLYDSFLLALGSSSVKRNATLLEAFTCGIFQIQLLAKIDISGSRQIAEAIRGFLPLFYARCFVTLINNSIVYFMGLGDSQIALLELMQPMDQDYAQQMWSFQSHLFFHDGISIEGLENLNPLDWYEWVLDRAQKFDTAYPNQLKTFSQSKITLPDIPSWAHTVKEFAVCDAYIQEVWGYSSNSLATKIEILEYRALMIHLIYSSLTSSRD